MFGTLRPHRCALSTDTRLVHRRLYCGLCKTMGDDYGQLSRALVSHDAVLMGAVVEALAEEAPAAASCRCPINPTQHRPTFAPDSVPMQFAAATQVLLADQWLADRAAEGGAVARLLRPAGRRAVQQATAALSALGASPERLGALEAEQLRLEATAPSPRAAAQPTAQALAEAFSWAARAPGMMDLSDEAHQSLAALGAAVGETIYGIDALEDLADDLRSGAFNPCIRAGRLDAEAVEACARLLDEAHRTIHGALGRIPWRRDRELLDNVLLHQQGARARRAVSQARALVQAGVPSPLERLLATLATLWLWLTARLSASLPGEGAGDSDGVDEAFEPRKRRRRRKKKKGGDDGDDGGSFDAGDACCLECCCDAADCLPHRHTHGSGCFDISLPGPCSLDCCPCDGDGCGCQPDCGCCDCG